jgi:hypothetical protein
MGIQEFIGRALGATVAPITFLGSLIRGARLFHPDGVVYRAEVKPIAQGGPLGQLAQRLAGTALVRLSGALWKWPQGTRAPDVLGVAMRFRSLDEVTPRSLPGDQDLLLATSPSVPGLVLALFRTDVSDFLSNQYYAILPFDLEGAGKVHLRLVPTHGAPAGHDRHERLALAVAQRTAVLRLEMQVEGAGEPWLPIAAIDLRERLTIDDRDLAFDPASSAMGLVPHGVLQRLRLLAYAASRAGRRPTPRGDRAAAAGVAAASTGRDARPGKPAEGGLEQR